MQSNRDYETQILNLEIKIKEYQEHFIMLNGKMKDLEKENQELKEEINELSKDALCFEKRCDKLEKVIKDYCYIDNFEEGEIIRMCCESYEESNSEDFEFIKEVLGE